MGLRIILIGLFSLISSISYGQHFMNYLDISKYVITDSLTLERINIYSPFDYESDKVINAGNGDYLIEMPHKDKMIIKMTKDRKKAIVVYNSIIFGRHKEFNIKDNERRLVLWYEDDHIYCGYIYDKIYKVCKYFESRL